MDSSNLAQDKGGLEGSPNPQSSGAEESRAFARFVTFIKETVEQSMNKTETKGQLADFLEKVGMFEQKNQLKVPSEIQNTWSKWVDAKKEHLGKVRNLRDFASKVNGAWSFDLPDVAGTITTTNDNEDTVISQNEESYFGVRVRIPAENLKGQAAEFESELGEHRWDAEQLVKEGQEWFEILLALQAIKIMFQSLQLSDSEDSLKQTREKRALMEADCTKFTQEINQAFFEFIKNYHRLIKLMEIIYEFSSLSLESYGSSIIADYWYTPPTDNLLETGYDLESLASSTYKPRGQESRQRGRNDSSDFEFPAYVDPNLTKFDPDDSDDEDHAQPRLHFITALLHTLNVEIAHYQSAFQNLVSVVLSGVISKIEFVPRQGADVIMENNTPVHDTQTLHLWLKSGIPACSVEQLNYIKEWQSHLVEAGKRTLDMDLFRMSFDDLIQRLSAETEEHFEED